MSTFTPPPVHAARPTGVDRLPPLSPDTLDEAQRAAAAELIAGPRKAVKGPFIPMLRSPGLLAPVQKVGEYLRFGSALERRVNEFATLVVSRHWTQQFEWAVHVPLAIAAGTALETIDALREGRRPTTMHADEALVYDFTHELFAHHGVCDATYDACLARFGPRGLVDLVGLVGYFAMLAMMLNVARTPREADSDVMPLPPFPR